MIQCVMLLSLAAGVGAWSPAARSATAPHRGELRATTPRAAAKVSADDMGYTTLGGSGLEVSKVCLGTMTWGEQNTMEEGVAQLDAAFDQYGINFLDTAEMYPVPTKAETQGFTDRTVGAWLRARGGASRRGEVVLATKVAGASERITWLRKSGEGTRVSRADIMESVDASLRRLGTDYVDLLQIHWPDRYVPLFGAGAYDPSLERDDAVPFLEQLEAMRDLIEAGKVRHLGLSNETPWGICEFRRLALELPGLPMPVSVQNSYSLLVRSDFESGGLSEVCSPSHANVGLLAYSPLAGGILTGKYREKKAKSGGTLNAEARLNLFPGFMSRYKQSLAVDAVDAYCAVGKKHGLSPTELSLAWCYSRPWVASTIIGATSLEQLEEDVAAYKLAKTFTKEMSEDIDEVYKRYRDPSRT